MVTLPHSVRLIPPKITSTGTVKPPHSVRLIPPKFTPPLDLSTRQHSLDANAAEPSSERIALPEPQIWDIIVLGIQITGIALFALSAWIGIFFIHALVTYTIFLSV